ncbi:Allergen V5/Tpx-1 related protein [Gloeomargarita lithophora Alchichica-D10]|uniref:Allergen V5/Tpx-1 related protein n=2 Tax=Gloeomargarita TaxID=1188227 RepID=A0A1J0AF28_9CYAN|nr:Allergen V5/Tpx-1 related protein [Gloeomargarita lithophora Alchichica-D10]
MAQTPPPEVKLAKGILTEVNQLRQNPPRYGEQLTPWRAYYQGKRWQPPGQPSQRTRAGVKGLIEAQTWLKQVQPLGVLRSVTGLERVAVRLIPQAINATELTTQLNAQGRWEGQASFCRTQGLTNARAILVSWLVDDGQKHRPNRTNLLNPLFRVAGVACVPRPQMQCVLILAGGYHAPTATPKPNPPRPSSPKPP